MKTKRTSKMTMGEIQKFVEKSAEKEFGSFLNNEKINEIKKILDKSSSKESPEFTFTVGNVNAYLG